MSLVVYFDGVCNLCNGFVDFLMRQDRAKVLRYASLQGETARAAGIKAPEGINGSIIVAENGKHYTEADAVLRIFTELGGVWRLARRLVRKRERRGRLSREFCNYGADLCTWAWRGVVWCVVCASVRACVRSDARRARRARPCCR